MSGRLRAGRACATAAAGTFRSFRSAVVAKSTSRDSSRKVVSPRSNRFIVNRSLTRFDDHECCERGRQKTVCSFVVYCAFQNVQGLEQWSGFARTRMGRIVELRNGQQFAFAPKALYASRERSTCSA
jgi:hypothetical protein